MIRDLLQRYQGSLLIGLVLILPLAMMYWHGKPDRDTTVIEKVLMTLTAPLQSGTRGTLGSAGSVIDDYVLLTQVKQRNKELERDNRVLLGEALKSRALQEELRRVKQLCEFKQGRKDLDTVAARVIGREVSQFFRVLRVRIDTTGLPKLRTGLAVITHTGVVGRIDKLSGDWADVLLVTDSRSRAHATVSGKGVVGTVRGQGRRNQFGVTFSHLDRADRRTPIEPGDAVITTGHDRVFPPGLEIGHVASGRSTQKGHNHQYTLTPAVAFATLEEVLVVTGYRAVAKPKSRLPAPEAARRRRVRVDPANTPDG